jgi:hypothetical protein
MKPRSHISPKKSKPFLADNYRSRNKNDNQQREISAELSPVKVYQTAIRHNFKKKGEVRLSFRNGIMKKS